MTREIWSEQGIWDEMGKRREKFGESGVFGIRWVREMWGEWEFWMRWVSEEKSGKSGVFGMGWVREELCWIKIFLSPWTTVRPL